MGLRQTGKGIMKSFDCQHPKVLENAKGLRVSKIDNIEKNRDIPLYCAYCGSPISPKSEFCEKCRKPLYYNHISHRYAF